MSFLKSGARFPSIGSRSEREAEKIFSKDLNLARSAADFLGPMFGNPSKMKSFCCFGVRKVFEGRKERGEDDFLAKMERRSAVSFSFFENRIGT